MTQTDTPLSWHLPDPERQPEFYRDVPLKRFLAFWADTLVIFALSLVAVVLTAFTGLFFFPLLFLVVGFGYRSYMLACCSATWGMRLAAIEFRDRDGNRLDTQTALLHTAIYSVAWMIPVLQMISMGLMVFQPRGQGLSDLALGTVALNCRARS
ncbi:RDD family protein [Roseovarius sp. C7]|uniref:RDD family protein n=1 Tax=Roseovarius sp. C7 TaxID=3398643 RepID=UPI0039F60882